VPWVEARLREGLEVHVVYESCGLGYGLYRSLIQAGAHCYCGRRPKARSCANLSCRGFLRIGTSYFRPAFSGFIARDAFGGGLATDLKGDFFDMRDTMALFIFLRKTGTRFSVDPNAHPPDIAKATTISSMASVSPGAVRRRATLGFEVTRAIPLRNCLAALREGTQQH
jgi:hypothetical protein